MDASNKQIIEINGIKMEVDLRTARRVDEFRVGDPVKVLVNETHQQGVYPGVIVDFEAFASLPTIVVAYVTTEYYSAGLRFAHVNAKSADRYEIVASSTDSMLAISKSHVVERLDNEIDKKAAELAELQQKKAYFLERFGAYFGEIKEPAA